MYEDEEWIYVVTDYTSEGRLDKYIHSKNGTLFDEGEA
jgi:hypothetical protein